MIRNVLLLIAHDLAIAVKNKTLYLVLFAPIFVFLTLKMVDANETGRRAIHIALIESEQYSPAIVQSIQSADRVFAISWLENEQAGVRWLKEKQGDGVLVPSGSEAGSVTLIVLTKGSLQSFAIIESVGELQRAFEGSGSNWIADVRFLHESGIQKQMLPTWMLMLVLLVGFIVLPAQVAEEKEKRQLLGLLQTPLREVEWLLSKVCLGMILVGGAALLLQLLAQFDFDLVGGLSYVAFLVAGGFCFSAFGICVGFLCRTQASARTLGVLFYLPHLLPSALSDFSQKLTTVAPIIPSYPLYAPLKAILLEGASAGDFPGEWFALMGIGSFTIYLSHRLMKKRWLM